MAKYICGTCKNELVRLNDTCPYCAMKEIEAKKEMSTPLSTPQPQLTVRKYRKNWKSRATYGLVLKTKLEYLMALFEQAANKPTIILPPLELYPGGYHVVKCR